MPMPPLPETWAFERELRVKAKSRVTLRSRPIPTRGGWTLPKEDQPKEEFNFTI